MNFIISGGGTGGHIFPAVAIAKELQTHYPKASILFVGAADRMEMEKVPAAGFPIVGLPIRGFNRSSLWKNLGLPFLLLKSLWMSFRLLRQKKPVAVIGTGGFASGPLLWMAAKMGYPTLIHEQNYFAGLTNKLLGKTVDQICTPGSGLEAYFPPAKISITGNPVRKDLTETNTNKTDAANFFQLKSDGFTVFITGGSLGAGSINKAIMDIKDQLLAADVQIIWQCGKMGMTLTATLREKPVNGIWVDAFIQDMAKAYALADVVVCRAGAITLSELSLQKKAAILVPSPNVAEDHQTQNALKLQKADAAILLAEKEISNLLKNILELKENPEKRAKLEGHIAEMATPQATEKIVECVKSIMNKSKK